jgi:two-component system, cell cycle response regulator DivK
MTNPQSSRTRETALGSARTRRRPAWLDQQQLRASYDRLQGEVARLQDQLVRSVEENGWLRASAQLWIGLYERQLARANALARSNAPERTGAEVVLLVQADRDHRNMYAESLLRNGFRPVVTDDPHDALRLADKVDAIVTGIMLAGDMDGVELVARLTRADHTRHIPTIVLTTCSWPSERQRAERAGCALFLAKPCLPDQLIDGLRHVLPQPPARV